MKKMLSVVLSLLLCLWSIPISMIGVAEEWKPFEGSGTADDPYQIDSAYKLKLLSELIDTDDTALDYNDKYYIQTTDIDLKNDNFTPIGKYPGIGFSGNYDGNYHSINNLNIDENRHYVGVFGWVTNGNIKNLDVNGNIKVGTTDNGELANIVGGIVGELCDNGSIFNCSYCGEINANGYVGGICGAITRSATVNNCFVNGKIVGNGYDNGGIVGRVTVGDSNYNHTVENCYAVGSMELNAVADEINIGGIVGNVKYKAENCSVSITNNYYLNSMAEEGINGSYTDGCSKLSETLMKSADELLGSPFIHNDDETINNGYPIFEWQGKPYEFAGSGTDEDPYQISCKEDLFAFKQMVSSPYFSSEYAYASYKQMNDIDLNNELWDPRDFTFRGYYDGNFQKVENVNVDTDTHYAGFFGLSYGVITSLSVTGNVTSSNSYVGGICGEIRNNAKIINCSFNGNVKGDKNVGGIVGKVYTRGSICSCYHVGNVEAASKAGGILGFIMYDSADTTIENCYHSGKVTSADEYAGAIVGKSELNDEKSPVVISNCFYTQGDAEKSVNGEYTSCDALQLSSKLLMKIADDLGEEFITNKNQDLNNGYPIFYWQVKGDMNLDGILGIADAVTLQKYLLAEEKFTERQYKVADLNGDKTVNVYDMITMREIIIENGVKN